MYNDMLRQQVCFKSPSRRPRPSAIRTLLIAYLIVSVNPVGSADLLAGESQDITYPVNGTLNRSAIEHDISVSEFNALHPFSEYLESATLQMSRPDGLVSYTNRGFPLCVELAICNYTSHDISSGINSYLRNSTFREEVQMDTTWTDIIEQHICGLDAAMAVSTMPEDIVLYRGIGGSFASTIRNQSSYIEDGYASTSYDATVPYHYAAEKGRDAEGYVNVLVIMRRMNETGLFIDEAEREILLPRGTAWDVIKEIAIGNATLESYFELRFPESHLERIRLIYLKERSIQGGDRP